MPQRSIRFSDRVLKEVDTVWRTRGFASPTAFIRYAVKQELSERQEGLTVAEEHIAGDPDPGEKGCVPRCAGAASVVRLRRYAGEGPADLRAGAAGRREAPSPRMCQKSGTKG